MMLHKRVSVSGFVRQLRRYDPDCWSPLLDMSPCYASCLSNQSVVFVLPGYAQMSSEHWIGLVLDS